MWFCVIVEYSSPLASSYLFTRLWILLCCFASLLLFFSLLEIIIVFLFFSFLSFLSNSWLLLLLLLLSRGRMMSSRASVEETCAKAFLVTYWKSSEARESVLSLMTGLIEASLSVPSSKKRSENQGLPLFCYPLTTLLRAGVWMSWWRS